MMGWCESSMPDRWGRAVVVPPGTLARYAAPVHARMLFVYGPSTDGHAMSDGRYEELTAPDALA